MTGSVSFTSNGTFTVPAGVSAVLVDARGGKGRDGNGPGGAPGGKGGRVVGTLPVTPGDVVHVLFAGAGLDGTGAVSGGAYVYVYRTNAADPSGTSSPRVFAGGGGGGGSSPSAPAGVGGAGGTGDAGGAGTGTVNPAGGYGGAGQSVREGANAVTALADRTGGGGGGGHGGGGAGETGGNLVGAGGGGAGASAAFGGITGITYYHDTNTGAPSATLTYNNAPTAPTLTYPTGGLVIDRTVPNRFAWTVNDPDAGDVQSKYELRYRITGTPTWTTVSAVTISPFRDVAAGTLSAGDYEWQVRTYDSQGEVGPWSGSEFFSAATAPVGPTITSPTNGTVVTTSTGVLAFSYPTLQARQVRKVADIAGAPDTATVYYDSDIVEDPAGRSQSLAYPTNERYEHLQVRVRDGGLWSPWSSVRVLVSLTAPAPPYFALTSHDELAAIDVTPTAGTDDIPTVPPVSMDIYRRPASSTDPTGVRLATGVLPDTTWRDHTPASGVDYAYRVVAFGANGTSNSSGWGSAPYPGYADAYSGAPQ